MTLRHYLLGLMALGVAFGAEDFADRFQRLMDEGQAAESSDPQAALAKYRQARELAIAEHQAEARGNAALNIGRIIQNETASQPEALALYREVAEGRATVEQAAKGWNNLGVLYFHMKLIPEALQAFERLNFKEADASVSYLFHYNYGAALESGQQPEAFQQYANAVSLAPDYAPAMRKAVELAPDASRAASVCQVVVKAGEAAGANDCLRLALKGFAANTSARDLLPLEIELLTAAGRDQALEKETTQFLNDTFQRTPADARAVLEQARGVFLGPAPVPVEWGEQGLLARWPKSADMSSRLLGLAKSAEKDGDFARALWRYAASWWMAPGNLEAAAGFVAILNDHPSLRDHDNQNKVPGLIDEIYPRIDAPSPHRSLAADSPDPDAALRLHLALGEYLQRGKGCQPEQGEADPHFPLFHWRAAMEAEKRMHEKDNSLPPTFILGKRLAGCFRAGGSGERKKWVDYQRDGFQANRPLYTTSDLAAYHEKSVYFPGSWLRAGAGSVWSQWRHDPKGWPLGTEGFAERYAAAMGSRLVRQAIAFGIDSALKEEPHYLRLGRAGLKGRVENVLRQTLLCYNRNGNYTFSFWRVGSAYGSALVSNAWRPEGYTSVRGALGRGTLSLAGDTGSNALKEFLPDLTRRKGLHWLNRVLVEFIQ